MCLCPVDANHMLDWSVWILVDCLGVSFVEFNQSISDTWQIISIQNIIQLILNEVSNYGTEQPLTFSFRQRITSWIVHLKNTDDLVIGYQIMESCVVLDWY